MLNTKEPLNTVKCVQSLQKQTMAGKMEILVIDNHSNDDSIGILRNRLGPMTNVRILESSCNAGFGGGYGIGIRQITGKYVMINNPAKILQPDALEKMAKRLEADETIGIISPKLVHEDGTIRSSARSFPRLSDVILKRALPNSERTTGVRRYLQSDVSPDEERTVDWVIGGCMMMRTDVMRQLGGFDPRFFLFFEDIDLCRRTKQLGRTVLYFPAAVAIDKKQRLSEMPLWKLPFKHTGRAHIASALKYFWKWRNR